MKNIITITLITILLYSCREERQVDAFISSSVKDTLDMLLEKYNQKNFKTVQLRFRKSHSNECWLAYEFYKNSIENENSFEYHGKTIVFFDDQSNCAERFIKRSFLNNQSINTGVFLAGKIDTINAIIPSEFGQLYIIDKEGMLRHVPEM